MSKLPSRIKKHPRLQIELKDNCLDFDLILPKNWAFLLVLMLILKYLPEWWPVIQTVSSFAGK